MATELTTPIDQAAITYQAVTRVEFLIPHTWAGDAAAIDRDRVQVRYEVTTYDAAGNIVYRSARIVPFADWPQVFIDNTRAVYANVITDAKTNGLVGDGTDEAL